MYDMFAFFKFQFASTVPLPQTLSSNTNSNEKKAEYHLLPPEEKNYPWLHPTDLETEQTIR